MRGPLLLLLLSACRPDGGLTVYDTPPEVAFTSPSDGTTVATGAWVTFTAALHDAQQPVGDLELVWQDSDGSTPAGTQTLLEEGVTYVVEGFEAGDRTITLTAVDQQGEEGPTASRCTSCPTRRRSSRSSPRSKGTWSPRRTG